jgi:hypothetical protein
LRKLSAQKGISLGSAQLRWGRCWNFTHTECRFFTS